MNDGENISYVYSDQFANSESRIKANTKVGRLTIKKYLGYTQSIRKSRGKSEVRVNHKYLADCDCGNKDVVVGEDNIKKAIRCNAISSCGCYSLERAKTIHMYPRTKPYKRIHPYHKNQYISSDKHVANLITHLNKIIDRCCNPSNPSYMNYGGRGISVYNEWTGKNKVDNFCNWMYKEAGYTNNMEGKVSINRVDNDGDYCPNNCTLTYQVEQSNNTRTNRRIDWYGVIYSGTDISRKYNMKVQFISKSLYKNRPVEDIVIPGNIFEYKKDRDRYFEMYPTNHQPTKAFVHVPFIYVDHTEIYPSDPRRYYPNPNYKRNLEINALQQRFKSNKSGHIVKPFEYTNSNSDEFLWPNNYYERM